MGAVPVYVSMNPPEWSFSPKDLEMVVTSRTRGIMINTPATLFGKGGREDRFSQLKPQLH